jgi:putative oxygen-independent coproporphyrinogen III oxidase
VVAVSTAGALGASALPAVSVSTAVLPRATDTGPGLYVHIPFCASRCDYCAFATWTDRHHLAGSYVDACIAHYETAVSGGFGQAATVFLGGGTPSQLPPADLVRLVSAIDIATDGEVTVEANPEDVTSAWLDSCLSAGVTRVSLGAQSFDQEVLTGLGRLHSASAIAPAVAAIGRAGISRCSIDLIYGGAGETDASWCGTLQAALDLEPRPTHLSVYALTVENGTPLWRDPTRHPDDDVQARRYEVTEEVLSSAGFEWYEISNWAMPGHECRHNLNYWLQGDYQGIGCAAHSHRAGRRWWNVRTPERYIQLVAAGQDPVASSEQLSEELAGFEGLELQLRTRWGVPAGALATALESAPELERLVEVGGERATLTVAGRMLANEVACRLEVPDPVDGPDGPGD